MRSWRLDPPDFRTISEFRKRHLKALGGLFVQVLKLCEKAGLVKLGHVALDGTKIKANASKHKAMSYERMKKREAELEAEVAKWLESGRGGRRGGGQAVRPRQDRRRDAGLGRRQEAACREDPRGQGRAGGGGEGGGRGQASRQQAEAEEKRQAEGRRKPGRQAAPPSTRARRQGPEELHRSGEPHHEDQGRLHPGLQRPGRGRRRGADHRGARRDAEPGR